ncbi:dienelactone hydrolase family protein [Kribbella sp. CA-293567]|uniref:dienelactone hydrolase family protein n=1 Tax=Kribbella sp. CA-293567 TaxID=3002436 RepID=UPI0022DE7C49|nr:dienelactone hydrolase family protein [Kribbella sp. CA-293567]WBQ05613.1 dienelactone hydrolase family protein [Kribbella sp. CA-293567]
MDIEAGQVRIGELGAYLARPVGVEAGPGMLLLPMITGIGEQLRDWADELAGRGITALVWDPFKGRSTDDSSREELFALADGLDDDTALAEQAALLDHLLDDLGCTRAGTIGWCLGGRFSLLLAAREPRVATVVAYHPTVPSELRPNQTHDAIADSIGITAPVMVVYPGADAAVPVADFEALQTALQSRGTGATITHFHPGVEHGFADRFRHDKPANVDAFRVSWPQALAFIDATTA